MHQFNQHKEEAMKVKVISVFRDKFTGKYYTPGEVIEVSEESRVLDMESRRLAERVEAKTTEVKAPEEKKEVKISLFEKEFESHRHTGIR